MMNFYLGIGLPIVKVAVNGRVEALRVEAPCRFGVLPDFFADDLVVDARSVSVNRAQIPSDNFFLHMIGEGEAIVSALWEKNVRDIELSLEGEGEARLIKSSDIFWGNQSSIWVSVLEEKGIWYWTNMTRTDGEKGKQFTEWDVPFLAKWKGNFMREDDTIESVKLILKPARGKRGIFVASIEPARDLNYEAYRKAYVGYNGPMVAYPISREEASRPGTLGTPLDRLCIDDLLRHCLGTEACGYILDVESRRPQERGIFTCSYGKTPSYFILACPRSEYYERTAETWKEDRAFMKRETLAVMTFIKFIQDRINTYVDMPTALLKYLDEAIKKYPEQVQFVERLKKEMEKPTIVFQRPVKPEVRANGAEIFKPWMAEMLKAPKIDTPEQAIKGFSAAKAPQIGDPQDARLAGLRKQVKVWRAMATIEMTKNPKASEIAREVRRMTEEALRNPSNYERDVAW